MLRQAVQSLTVPESTELKGWLLSNALREAVREQWLREGRDLFAFGFRVR